MDSGVLLSGDVAERAMTGRWPGSSHTIVTAVLNNKCEP